MAANLQEEDHRPALGLTGEGEVDHADAAIAGRMPFAQLGAQEPVIDIVIGQKIDRGDGIVIERAHAAAAHSVAAHLRKLEREGRAMRTTDETPLSAGWSLA